MSLRPIDFIGAIFNLKRGEKLQSQRSYHNLVMQQNIGEETKKQIMENMRRVVDTKNSQGASLLVKEKKREENRKRRGKYSLYSKKKRQSGPEGIVIDREA